MSVRAGGVDVRFSLRTLLLVVFVVAVTASLLTILDALMIVFVGVFLALVFEIPVRMFAKRTGISRGLSATIVVIGSALILAVLALIVFVKLVGSVRDFLKELPQVVAELRESDELSWLGDSGAAENVQDGANQVSASIPDAISGVLGLAGDAFGVLLALTTILFLALFLLVDMARLREALGSVLMPRDAERWLDIWERITRTVSRWAIGAATIAVIAGTVQGGTAAILGSSYAIALGVIAGLLDLIPNIGATIAGFILVPVILAEEGIVDAVIMLVVILVYQQVENNLLTPTIQGKATNISAFFVILSVTLFGAFLGVLGALVAVPVAASIQLVVQELTAERRKRVAEARAALASAAEPPPEVVEAPPVR